MYLQDHYILKQQTMPWWCQLIDRQNTDYTCTWYAENYEINLGRNVMIQTIVPGNDKQGNLQFVIQVFF